MTTSYDLPDVGDHHDGALIIASVWGNDDYQDDGTPPFGIFILLRPEQEKAYAVTEAECHGEGWTTNAVHGDFHNIVEAVRCYEQNGGDI